GFSQDYDWQQTRERFGLPLDKKVVLVLAGAHLPQPYVRFRSALDQMIPYLHLFSEMQMVFIAGRDGDYAAHLRREKEERNLQNMTVFDYVEDMAALMAVSDIAICKAGGLTVTECLCARLPMILLGKAYGQENINVRMLTAAGAASHVTTYRELMVELRRILRNPQVVEAMLLNGGFIRRPNAAEDIALAALDLAERELPKNDPRRKKHFLHFYWGGKPAHTR
ncbi:MAG: glycosyltransferase, partial [Eggerthellaceae bacterium]